MKLDLKDKKTLGILACVLIVLVPILYNQGKSLVTGLITSYKMSQPKMVEVANPVEKTIEPVFETTGRVEADNSINVIARVDGWLQGRYFEEGDIVKKGQRLFQIQPEDYKLAAQDASARVSENAAVYKNAVINYRRAAELVKDEMVSREYYDDSVANMNRTKAALDAAKAQYQRAKLNYSYTSVTAPMSGRIGKALVSEGNYVTQGTGNLATIYQTSPIKVSFALKSSDHIQMKKYRETKDAKNPSDIVEVYLKLSDGSMYDKAGKIEFMDNKIDEDTGSVSMSAIFENPSEILMPGDYVNVVLKMKVKTPAMMIPQTATKTDVGTGYYVWAVEDNKTVKKDIKVERNYENNWIVESGLKYTDVIITKGIQNIYHSGQAVKATPSTPDKEEKEAK